MKASASSFQQRLQKIQEVARTRDIRAVGFGVQGFKFTDPERPLTLAAAFDRPIEGPIVVKLRRRRIGSHPLPAIPTPLHLCLGGNTAVSPLNLHWESPISRHWSLICTLSSWPSCSAQTLDQSGCYLVFTNLYPKRLSPGSICKHTHGIRLWQSLSFRLIEDEHSKHPEWPQTQQSETEITHVNVQTKLPKAHRGAAQRAAS